MGLYGDGYGSCLTVSNYREYLLELLWATTCDHLQAPGPCTHANACMCNMRTGYEGLLTSVAANAKKTTKPEDRIFSGSSVTGTSHLS